MKISDNYTVREIMNESVLVPIKGSSDSKSRFITLNETGKIIVDGITNQKSIDCIVADICEEYEIDVKTAADDVDEFISSFKKLGVIVD